jgi:hypothetical protein
LAGGYKRRLFSTFYIILVPLFSSFLEAFGMLSANMELGGVFETIIYSVFVGYFLRRDGPFPDFNLTGGYKRRCFATFPILLEPFLSSFLEAFGMPLASMEAVFFLRNDYILLKERTILIRNPI